MSEFRLVRDYPQSPLLVWRALTEPTLVALWTASGRGGRPVGFSTSVGTQFQYVARPLPGWSGIVHCEVLETIEPSLLRYSWRGDGDDEVTMVTCRIEWLGSGTRLSWEHTGFTGLGGWFMCKLLSSVRTKMLQTGFARVLMELESHPTTIQ